MWIDGSIDSCSCGWGDGGIDSGSCEWRDGSSDSDRCQWRDGSSDSESCESGRGAVGSSHDTCAIDKAWVLGTGLQTARLTWRCINDQIIQFSPSYFGQKLPDHSIFLGSSPDHTVPTIFEQETNTHDPQPPPLIHIDRNPTR